MIAKRLVPIYLVGYYYSKNNFLCFYSPNEKVGLDLTNNRNPIERVKIPEDGYVIRGFLKKEDAVGYSEYILSFKILEDDWIPVDSLEIFKVYIPKDSIVRIEKEGIVLTNNIVLKYFLDYD